MDRVTEAYLAACAEPGSPLRTASDRLSFEHFFARTWGARQLARPLFVREPHVRQAAADLETMFEVLFTLPDRLFGGDLGALCAELGMGERATVLACAAAATGRTPLYTRPDLYYDGTSFTLLELNAGTECGGVDGAAINEAYLALPEFRAFAGEHQLGYVDTGEKIAEYLRELTGREAPVVALIDIAANLDAWGDHYRAWAAHMVPRGVDIRISHIADLGSRDGKLTVDGTPVDAAVRYFTLEEICAEPRAQEWLAPVLRAHEEGKTAFIASLDYGIYANKGILALVSELRDRGELAADEAAMVDRILPWTRRVTPDVWEQCRANRAQLLLKPAVGGGGSGVTTGWDVTDEEWEVAFKNALRTPHIVQGRAGVRLEPVPDEDGNMINWLPVYGMFILERGYAGSFIRTLPAATGNVVNVNTGAAFTSVFSVPGSE